MMTSLRPTPPRRLRPTQATRRKDTAEPSAIEPIVRDDASEQEIQFQEGEADLTLEGEAGVLLHGHSPPCMDAPLIFLPAWSSPSLPAQPPCMAGPMLFFAVLAVLATCLKLVAWCCLLHPAQPNFFVHHMVRADLTQLQYEMPEDDEDEEEDGLASPSAAAEGNENEPPSSSGGPEQRKVAILLELLSAGNAALETKIAQFREEIDLDMLKVRTGRGDDRSGHAQGAGTGVW